MNEPLGSAAGNWLEVKESVDCLKGGGPEDLRALVIELAASLLLQTGRASTAEAARDQALACLVSGEPLKRWTQMLEAQGTDLDAYEAKLTLDHTAPVIRELRADGSGIFAQRNARIVGEVVRSLGGGRLHKDSIVQPEVGVDQLASCGTQVKAGQTLARIHAMDEDAAEKALATLASAFRLEA
jgi:thymidine phosphorylase